MGLLLFYRTRSEQASQTEVFIRDFERQSSQTIEVIDPDSPRGVDLCRIYDVVEFPTLVATTQDGQMRNLWRGLPLPTINEVSYYVQ